MNENFLFLVIINIANTDASPRIIDDKSVVRGDMSAKKLFVCITPDRYSDVCLLNPRKSLYPKATRPKSSL